MNTSIRSIDSTIRALMPAETAPTKIDKTIELLKTLSVNSIPGVIGQAIETTGKVWSIIISENQRIKAIKYVADAYEVKCRSEVELARINAQQQQK